MLNKNNLNLILYIFFILLLLFKIIDSLNWRMELDTPLLHYLAFLMDNFNKVPYKDIFETSMPATIGFHYFIVHYFGTNEFVFRITDLIICSIISFSTFIFIRRLDKTSAFWAPLIFLLDYFSKGQIMSLQRDFLCILPLSICLALLPTENDYRKRLKLFFIGILLSISFLIKPHTLIFIIPLIVFISNFNAILFLFAGFSIPLLITYIYLQSSGALNSFIDIFINYLPLHNQLSGFLGEKSFEYLFLETFKFYNYKIFVIIFIISFFILKQKITTNKNLFYFLSALTFIFLGYPTIAGKFWDYHYAPVAYFLSLSISLIFINKKPLITILVSLILILHLNLNTFFITKENYAPLNGRADKIAKFLKENKAKKVQVLDWTRGSIHSLLLAKTDLATKYMYNYHFFHHNSNPYIINLRKDFMLELKASQPEFIIYVKDSPLPQLDSKKDFNDLVEYILTNYKVNVEEPTYTIYRKYK